MLLTIENIAKIRKAEIELNGITVIAGENNTGKSTVGKALFSLINAFFNLDENIREQRIASMASIIQRHLRVSEPVHAMIYWDITLFFNQYIDLKDPAKRDVSYLEKYISKFLERLSENLSWRRMISTVVPKIIEILLIDDEAIQNVIINKYIQEEFNGQINSINNESIGSILISSDFLSISTEYENNLCINSADSTETILVATYIDTPYAMDDTDASMGNIYYHRDDLCLKTNYNLAQYPIDEAIRLEKLKSVLSKINNITNGRIEFDNQDNMTFKESGFSKPVNLKNLSTGLKTFLIIERLITNGALKEHDVLILDEPEIHLHPEWQITFAEILVLLQKEFDLTILLNTHSPYFLNAVEVFSQRHSISDKCKYYLSELEGTSAVFSDVTTETERIYAKLSKPFQQLEKMRYEEHDND